MRTPGFIGMLGFAVCACVAVLAQPATPPDELLLKDYRPRSIFNLPQTRIEKAKFPVIDVHTHVYETNQAGVDRWVKIMDAVGLEKSIILAGSSGRSEERRVGRGR